jgi:hypothetical protein
MRHGTKFGLPDSLAPGICTTLQLLDYMTSYPERQFSSTESYSLQFTVSGLQCSDLPLPGL